MTKLQKVTIFETLREKMGTQMFNRSGRLFAEPSFIEGMSRVLDLGNTLNVYNVSQNEKEADLASLLSDWSAVGDDIKVAISEFESSELGAK